MFSEAAKTFLECLKLAPRYLIALGAMAAVLLFASEEFLKLIGVLELSRDNRSVLGITLGVTSSLFAVTVAADAISIAKGWWRKRSYYRRVTNRMLCLTEDEKQILRFYIDRQTRANILRYDDGVVQSLVSDGIIYRSASIGNILEGFAHNISEFAWDYLNAHPELLEGTTNNYRTDKRELYW